MEHVIYKDLSPSERRLKRVEYEHHQEGRCFYCKGFLAVQPPASVTDKPINWRLFPPNFLRYPVHLQHDHKTGLTEGAVHAYCNAVMWQYHGR